MDLHEFLATASTNSDLAAALAVPAPLVSQWRTKARPVPIERCVQIERVTNAAVRRWDLRPHDWHLIWPELIDAEGAPAAPTAAAPAQRVAA